MCEVKKLMEPDKNFSTAAKGMAILAMVFLHLFCRVENLPYTPLISIGQKPLIYYFGLFGDICVPVYCFVSGYAQSLIYEKQNGRFLRGSMKRVGKLYTNYLVILVLFALIGFIVGSETIPGSVSEFIGNMFLISMSYNGAWWFILTYIFLIFLSPLLIKAVHKLNPFLIVLISGIVYFIAYVFRFIYELPLPGYVLQWLFRQALLIGTSQFSFVVGMVFLKFKIISRIKCWCLKKHLLIPVCVLIPIVMFLLHCFIQSLIIAPITGIAVLTCFYICPWNGAIQKIFVFFGRHSTNIWLTHMFFYFEPFEGLVFKAKYAIPAFLLMLALCLAVSYVVKAVIFAIDKISSLKNVKNVAAVDG